MKPFVLIVDDSLTVRMELRKHFAAAGIAVTACGTVATARPLLHSQSYDLAILDVTLPDGSGAALLAELKDDPELSHIPVIMLCTATQLPTETRLACQRAEGFVKKPYDLPQLIKLAESLCKSNLGGKKFLVVDDSPTFLSALAGQLRQEGNTVITAATGEEALAMLQREQVDCVVIDMVMPGIGGIETCRRLRALERGSDVPVVMLTAGENTSGRSQGLAIGADQFLIKSHRFDLLCAQIRGLLRKRQRAPRSTAELAAVTAAEAPAGTAAGAAGEAAAGAAGKAAAGAAAGTASGRLYDKLLASLGLSKSMAQLVLTRACRSVQLAPEAVTVAELGRLLPKLCDTLKMFLTPEQIAERVAAIKALAQSLPQAGAPHNLGSSTI